jgi:hypothetical protein
MPPSAATPQASAPSGGLDPAFFRRQSTVLVCDEDFSTSIEEARALCRTARTPFVAMMNPAEHQALEWGSIFHDLKPGVPTVSAQTLAGDNFLVALQRLLGQNSRHQHQQQQRQLWRVFPPHGISADDIAQGELGDCWFLSAVAVLAHSRPKLIEELFLVKEVNPEGVFAVRLCKDGEWTPFLVDGNFPTLYGRKVFRFARCKRNDAIWVPLLEKAYAMMHGSYQAIVSGRLDEAFYDLTGLPCERLSLLDDDNRERQFDAAETFARMASMHSGQCTMGASCGTTPASAAAAEQLRLNTRHCYSVLEVRTDPRTVTPMVRLRNPWGRSEYAGLAPPADGHQYDNISGSFWMSFDQFVSCFSDVVVCYTRDFAGGVSARPRCSPQHGYFPPLRDAPGVRENASATAVALHVAAPTTLRAMAVQPKLRGEGARNSNYFDVIIFIVKVGDGQARTRIVASSGGHCDRVVTFDYMADPGLYAVVPFSLQQSTSADSRLVLNVLSESDRVAQLNWNDVVPPRLNWNSLVYHFCLQDTQAHRGSDRNEQGCWRVVSWAKGTSRFELAASHSRHPSEVTLTAQGQNVVVQPNNQRRARLPPGSAAVMVAVSVTAHGGSYAMQYGHQYNMRETPTVGSFFGGSGGAPQNADSSSDLPPIFWPFQL